MAEGTRTKSVGESLQVMAIAPALYAVFVPGFFDLRQQDLTADEKAGARTGLYAASALTVGLGAAIALTDDDPVPFVAGAILAGVMVGLFEFSFKHQSDSTTAKIVAYPENEGSRMSAPNSTLAAETPSVG